MKVAISATRPSLDADTDPRFGRCSCFVIVETDDMSFEAVENANSTLGGGAGIQSAQLMAQKGAKAVLTGNCGPNAHQALSAAGIEVIVGCSGSVSEVVERFMSGQLLPSAAPNVASHSGMGDARR
jgi:predicted Fe-Mo cluster-binding NifX family protein